MVRIRQSADLQDVPQSPVHRRAFADERRMRYGWRSKCRCGQCCFRATNSRTEQAGLDPLQPDNGPNCSPDSCRSQAHSINETALLRMKIFDARHQTLVLKSSAAVQGERSRSRTVREFGLPAMTGCSSAAS
jgi:hypothetical protein